MYNIQKNGIVSLSRGECLKVPLFINLGTDEEPIRLDFRLFPSVEVYLGIYPPNSCFESSLIRKKYTTADSNEYGDIMVDIQPKDTLSLYPGQYYYEIKIRMYNDIDGEFVATVLNKTPFYLT